MNKFDLINLVVGGLMLGTGIYIRIWVDRRRFYRRGVGGLQQFPSYFKSKFYTFVERILMMFSIPLIFLGIIILTRMAFHMIDRTKISKNEPIENTNENKLNSITYFLPHSEQGVG